MAISNVSQLNEPLSYIEWLKTIGSKFDNESDIFREYKKYVSEWYTDKEEVKSDNILQSRDLYVNLLKEITLNYSTIDEQRFLSNINFNNKRDLDIAIPFFVKKIKEITKYFVKKRHEIKYAKQKANLKGSVKGIKIILKKVITDLITNDDFTTQFPTVDIPIAETLADSLVIEIEDLYDVYDHYFDIDPNIQKESYVSEDDHQRLKLFSSNIESIDPLVFIDLDKAIQNLFNKFPTGLATDEGFILLTDDNLELGIISSETDINDLPNSEFIDPLEKTEANLNIINQGKLVKKLMSTRFDYISTNATNTHFVSGILFEPTVPYSNPLNIFNSSRAGIRSTVNLKSIKEIGGFYTPDKIGILKYTSFNSVYDIDSRKLDSNTIYIFPNPEQLGAGRGNSLTDNDSPIFHNENVKAFKADIGNEQAHGTIVDDERVAKHYSYQSREETQDRQVEGISRVDDSIDFWTGDVKTIWNNADIYPLLPLEVPDTSGRLEDLHITDHSIQTWHTDIFGNEFALFKKINKTRTTINQTDNDLVLTNSSNAVNSEYPNITQFQTPNTKYYDFIEDDKTTEYESVVDILSATDRTIYESIEDVQGKLIIRDVYSSLISPASAALSAVFIKYENDEVIKNELNNNIKNFNIYRDVIVIETPTYHIFEKYTYNFETRKFNTVVSNKVYIEKTQPAFEKFADSWYIERDNKLIICKTTIHPYISGSTYKAVYPTIYVLDLKTFDFKTIHSLQTMTSGATELNASSDLRTGWAILSSKGYSLIDSGLEIGLTNFDKPLISLNQDTNVFTYNCIATDYCSQKYFVNFYYDLFQDVLTINQLHLIKPDFPSIFNGSFTDYHILSSFLHKHIDLRSSDFNIKDEYDETGYHGLEPPYTLSGWDIWGNINDETLKLGVSTNDVDNKESLYQYAYNTSYIVYSSACEVNKAVQDVGSADEDLIICFDFALYTNTAGMTATGFQIIDVCESCIVSEDGFNILIENGDILQFDEP
tara:strand:+ start:14464 stop:17448 length:2985 start_codon:yes stop_codon:yes gene_type:complete